MPHPQRYHLSLSVSCGLLAARLTSLPAPVTMTPLVGAGALLYRLLLPIAARRTSANRDGIITAIARS